MRAAAWSAGSSALRSMVAMRRGVRRRDFARERFCDKVDDLVRLGAALAADAGDEGARVIDQMLDLVAVTADRQCVAGARLSQRVRRRRATVFADAERRHGRLRVLGIGQHAAFAAARRGAMPKRAVGGGGDARRVPPSASAISRASVGAVVAAEQRHDDARRPPRRRAPAARSCLSDEHGGEQRGSGCRRRRCR